MKKNVYLGLSKDKNKCCLLYSLATYNQLIEANTSPNDRIKSSDFNHYGPDWCGCGDTNHTLKSYHLEKTGRQIILSSPITFYGEDQDMGHIYPWSFTVFSICEVNNI